MSDDEKDHEYEREILFDEPSDSDDFAGQGHERTAEALARAIRNFNDKDRAIGLAGSWGSGKSTIVNLAEARLKESDGDHSYHVFTYDLWANQTTHFKRAFLEAFLNWGSQKFKDKEDFIIQKQSEIGDRKKIVKSENHRLFGWFGMLVIVFLYFTPIIYTWLTPSAFKDTNGDYAIQNGSIFAWVALAVIALSLAVKVKFSWPKEGSTKEKFKTSFSKSFSVFSKEADTTTVTQNIRDEDPTQYEFTKIFREIVSQFQSKENRLVVVFDNIDRLPQNRIDDVWSEVRSAFYRDKGSQNFQSAITAIVPYAESVVLQNPNLEKDDEYMQADLFRKSFDAIFHVSPPIILDAASFFKQKLIQGVKGQCDDDTASRVYRIFDLHVQTQKSPVTPRQVISFINETTNWWEQWQNLIPLETIAVFVNNQTELVNDPSILRNSISFQPRMQQHASQPHIIRDLAALSFNVPPEMAIQVLSHDAIKRALTANNIDDLAKLSKSSGTNGFEELLPAIIDEFSGDWAENSLGEFAATVRNLSDLDISTTAIEYSKKTMLNGIDRLNTTTIGFLSSNDAIWNIVKFSNQRNLPALVRKLSIWINRSLSSTDKQTFEEGKAWIRIVGKLCESVAKSFDEKTLVNVKKGISPPGGPSAVIGAAYDCDQTSCHMNEFKLVPNVKSVSEKIIDYANDSAAFQYAWPELKHLFDNKQKTSILESQIENLKTNIYDETSDLLTNAFDNLTKVYIAISNAHAPAKKAMRELFESAAPVFYAHRIHQTEDKPDHEIVAKIFWLCMTAFELESPEIQSPQGIAVFGNVSAAYEWFKTKLVSEDQESKMIDTIADYTITNAGITRILEVAFKEPENQSLFRLSSNAIFAKNTAYRPNASILINHFLQVRKLLGDNFEHLLDLVGSATTETYWKDLKLEEINPALVEIAAKRSEAGWEMFIARLDEFLKDISEDQWTENIEEDGTYLELLNSRNTVKPLHIPVSKFYEPLMKYSLGVIAGNQSPSGTANSSNLLAAIPRNSRARFAKDFYDRHNDHSKKIGTALNVIPTALGELPLLKNPEKTIDRYLLPLLKEQTKVADEFIESNSSSFQRVLEKANATSAGLVSEYVDSLDAAEDDRPERLRELLGMPKVKTIDKKETDSPIVD